ncbi:ABC transporter permease [Marinifilum fragile]|uniref:ABC transporter permease n=1 Tax=Marinifilum fragile TaxID=570161 RepID=UPI0006D269DC|nr:ABC transporter permease [Marinifilum fragile]
MKRLYNIAYQIEEIWHSLKEHKKRNLLTGFGVSWGIFILVLLVGAGNGLQKGVMVLFQDYTQNSFWIYGGKTNISKPGQNSGRLIRFKQQDLSVLKKWYPEIEHTSPELRYNGKLLNSKSNSYHRFECYGINSSYFKIKTYTKSQGRFFNPLDDQQNRNIAIIGKDIAEGLFEKEDVVGKYFCMDGVWFQIIGVLAEKSLFSNNKRHIYIPFGALQNHFFKDKSMNCFALSLKAENSAKRFEESIKNYLSKNYQFDVEDKNAIYINNVQSSAGSIKGLFKTINGFLWLVGFCMLLSGIVGVSNIMLVVVKERTQEIGIRKAIGASPKSILYMILNESIIITFISGVTGLLAATVIVNLINLIIGDMISDSNSIFKGLDVNIPIAIGAIITLVISGAIAGLYPARKAASVLPIKAISSENS